MALRTKHDPGSRRAPNFLLSLSDDPNEHEKSLNIHQISQERWGPLSLTLNDLSDHLGGSGRAAAVWDCLRAGIDPNLYYAKRDGDKSAREEVLDEAVVRAWLEANSDDAVFSFDSSLNEESPSIKQLNTELSSRRQGQGLGNDAWKKLQNAMSGFVVQQSERGNNIFTIENSIASVSHIKVSSDGTTKMLLKMAKDGLEVESVIIPWFDKGFSTLCVSSQVGCRQGCTFCATGRMGILRSLTADEILVQVYYASKVCRISNAFHGSIGKALPNIDNLVYMGMGEAGDNAESVLRSANILADRRMFAMAQSKVTISTVAPNPEAFTTLGQAPATLAWSVHAVDDSLRKQLVPTTKYSMEELRMGLVKALSARSNKLRRTMLEVALIEGVNDSKRDAELLAEFAQSIMHDVPGSKIVVNVIPYNSIDHPTYRTPSDEKVLEFQKAVVEHGSTDGRGVLCYVRTTRGDEESSACGQLATKKKRAAN